MIIGVPKEIKIHEYRVGLTPASTRELVHHGHEVIIETKAGAAIGFSDEAYEKVGAKIAASPAEVFEKSDMIVKVKEPQESEYSALRPDQILFTYLHLAPDPKQTKGLIDSGCIAIAYETVTDDHGGLPLLAPMSDVAGRMSIQVGAYHLEKAQGGAGLLLGGVSGVVPGNVVIIGGGVVGTSAARMAVGMGAQVSIIDRNTKRLQDLDLLFQSRVKTIYPTISVMEELVEDADLVIGAVLIKGKSAPRLLTREMLKKMRDGSVVVDVAIDQGGCFETSRPTTHSEPTYIEEGIIHYCVTNMPGAVPKTSAAALNNATLPHILNIANKGAIQAMQDDPHLRNGLNVFRGQVTEEAVASDLGYEFIPGDILLATAA